MDFFAPCPRGLEGMLARELEFIGASRVSVLEGGCRFEGDWALAYACNLRSRIASRILLQVAESSYRDEHDLYELALDLPWEQWHPVTAPLRVDLVGKRSPLQSLNFATLRVKDAICDRYRAKTRDRPSIDTQTPGQRVFVFVDESQAVVYRDLSGEPLFKRGWRLEKGAAPLRENLAAGLLALAGWNRNLPLIDPMCGSGTFIIEAAQIAAGIQAGRARAFGFQQALDYDDALFQSLKQAPGADKLHRVPPMLASDRDAHLITIAKRNLERAGLGSLLGSRIILKQGDAIDIAPHVDPTDLAESTVKGIIVANPPYGERISLDAPTPQISGPAGRAPRRHRGGQDWQAHTNDSVSPETQAFYADFAHCLKTRFAGWQAWILTNEMNLPSLMRLQADKRTPIMNGPIECRWFGFRLVEGSNRRVKPAA